MAFTVYLIFDEFQKGAPKLNIRKGCQAKKVGPYASQIEDPHWERSWFNFKSQRKYIHYFSLEHFKED